MAIAFEAAAGHFCGIIHALLPKLTQEVVLRDQLSLQILLDDLPVANEQKRFPVDGLSQCGDAIRQPVDHILPAHDRADEHDALGDRLVFIRHAVLRGVGDEQQDQQIGRAERACLPSNILRSRANIARYMIVPRMIVSRIGTCGTNIRCQSRSSQEGIAVCSMKEGDMVWLQCPARLRRFNGPSTHRSMRVGTSACEDYCPCNGDPAKAVTPCHPLQPSMPEFAAVLRPGFLPDQWNEATGEVVGDNRPTRSTNDLLQDLVLFGADRNHQPPANLELLIKNVREPSAPRPSR